MQLQKVSLTSLIFVQMPHLKLQFHHSRQKMHGWELLDALGYAQYEISNFCQPGAECRHNVNTWRMTEWIGCGPSAASQYAGQRYQRPANLEQWAAAMEAGRPEKAECVTLDDRTLLADAVIFGLRRNVGIDFEALVERFPAAAARALLEPLFQRLLAEGLLQPHGARLRLSHRGRLVCDAIGCAVLQALE